MTFIHIGDRNGVYSIGISFIEGFPTSFPTSFPKSFPTWFLPRGSDQEQSFSIRLSVYQIVLLGHPFGHSLGHRLGQSFCTRFLERCVLTFYYHLYMVTKLVTFCNSFKHWGSCPKRFHAFTRSHFDFVIVRW